MAKFSAIRNQKGDGIHHESLPNFPGKVWWSEKPDGLADEFTPNDPRLGGGCYESIM